ncbi:MAG: pyruvate kinase [Lentimonas sp.]|jgi:pyruvate kinase
MLERLIRAGVDICRINMARGDLGVECPFVDLPLIQ